jgi:hypothetical protein
MLFFLIKERISLLLNGKNFSKSCPSLSPTKTHCAFAACQALFQEFRKKQLMSRQKSLLSKSLYFTGGGVRSLTDKTYCMPPGEKCVQGQGQGV